MVIRNPQLLIDGLDIEHEKLFLAAVNIEGKGDRKFVLCLKFSQFLCVLCLYINVA